MQREHLMRLIAGPWYERGDFLSVYRITEATLDNWTRTGRVESRCLNGRYAYRTSSRAHTLRLVHSAATAPEGAAVRSETQTKDFEDLTPRDHSHARLLSPDASLPIHALNDLICILAEMPGELSDEQRDQLLVTLGILVGAAFVSCGAHEDAHALLESLRQLTARLRPVSGARPSSLRSQSG
jgi:hypothetical protein